MNIMHKPQLYRQSHPRAFLSGETNSDTYRKSPKCETVENVEMVMYGIDFQNQINKKRKKYRFTCFVYRDKHHTPWPQYCYIHSPLEITRQFPCCTFWSNISVKVKKVSI